MCLVIDEMCGVFRENLSSDPGVVSRRFGSDFVAVVGSSLGVSGYFLAEVEVDAMLDVWSWTSSIRSRLSRRRLEGLRRLHVVWITDAIRLGELAAGRRSIIAENR